MSKTRVQPITGVVDGVEVSEAEIAARVLRTREQHGDVLQQFHEVWYNAEHTWHYTFFLGVGVMKCPNDLWIYQDIIARTRPRTIIETGTFTGGSALYYATLLDLLGIDGRVITVDCDNRVACSHPKIDFLDGDSTDPDLVAAIRESVVGPVLVSLDSDHAAAHVKREMELYAPLVEVGGYLVVEDTNISWSGNGPGADRGARGGVEDYLAEHPGEWMQDTLCERYLLTMHPGGWLRRVRSGDVEHPSIGSDVPGGGAV